MSSENIIKLTKEESDLKKSRGYIFEKYMTDRSNEDRDEVLIGTNDLLPIAYLEVGIQKAKTVAFIGLPGGGATGFLVSKDLLLTNNHVYPNKEVANQSSVYFNFDNDIHGNPKPYDEYYCNAEDFFYTNEVLDYSLVKVNKIKKSDGSYSLSYPGERWGYTPIFPTPGPSQKVSLSINGNLTIIQHPGMRRKEIALRNNTFYGLNKDYPDFLLYKSDTEPGASGSPIYNDAWELIGLHHSAGEKINNVFINNEGIMISSIIKDMLSNFPNMKNGNLILAELGIHFTNEKAKESGSVSVSGSTDSRGGSTVTVTGTWNF